MQKLKNNVIQFDSMADMASYMKPELCFNSGDSESWFGGVSSEKAIKMLLTGDQSAVPLAEKMAQQFEVHICTELNRLDYSVAGFAPSVPDYLGGSPECMYAIGQHESTLGPLKVLVDCTSSASVSPAELQQRGAAILAAVMSLTATRPVSLEAIAITDCGDAHNFGGNSFCAVRVPINSSPVDLGSASFAMAHQGFARRMCYGLLRHHYQTPLMWPSLKGLNAREVRSPKVMRRMVELLGEEPDTTLFIPAAFANDPVLTDSKKWIAEVMATYGQAAETA